MPRKKGRPQPKMSAEEIALLLTEQYQKAPKEDKALYLLEAKVFDREREDFYDLTYTVPNPAFVTKAEYFRGILYVYEEKYSLLRKFRIPEETIQALNIE